MKIFTLPVLLAAALLSALAAIPFLPAAKKASVPFALEAQVGAATGGPVRIYFDVGRGYNAADTAAADFAGGGVPQRCVLPLPAGTYRSLRFDPIEGAGTATIAGPLRIVSSAGRVVRTIAPGELRALQQIETLRPTAAGLEVISTRAADDPQLVIAFSPPLELAVTWRERAHGFLPRMAAIFGGLLLGLGAFSRLTGLRAAIGRAMSRLGARPHAAVAWSAALAVIASAYPVVFLGQSHVSPNFDTTLLYENFPTVPGYDSAIVADPHGSDVAALMFQHVPYAFMQRRALASGELPWWNRYVGLGFPLLGQGQSMTGDPLQAFVVLCDGAAWAWDIKFLVAKWLFALGLGWIVLAVLRARSDSGALPAAVLVALAAPFIGFFTFRINHPAFFSVCYAPWTLYAWLRLAHATTPRERWRGALLLAVANVLLICSGTVKEAAVLLLAMNATGAVLVLVVSAPWRSRLLALAVGGSGGLVAVLLTAPAWGAFFDALAGAFTISRLPVADQMPPSLLLGFFDEVFFRPLSKQHAVFNPSLNILLLLGVLYFLATLRTHFAQRTALVVAGAAALAATVAFGVVPPAWIMRVPLFGNIGHIDNCASAALVVLGSVVAGLGFARALERLRTPEGRGDLAIVGLLGGALIALWLGWHQAALRTPPGAERAFVAAHGAAAAIDGFVWASLGALVLAAGGLLWSTRRARVRGVGLAPVLCAIACAGVLVWRHGLHARAVGFEDYVVQPPARAPFHTRSPAMDHIREKHAREPGRVFGMHGNLSPAWNAAYGLEAIHGADALQSPWVRELIDVSAVKWNSSWRVYVASREVSAARPLLDAFNVRHYVDLPSNAPLEDASLTRTLRADLDVYESRTAWPRAFFVDQVRRYYGPSDLVRMIGAAKAPFAALPLELGGNAAPPWAENESEVAATRVVPATDYRLQENATEFAVRATGPGLIVLTEAWWPGMAHVEINGRAATPVRVNHASHGIVVETAGDYRVSVRYRAPHATRQIGLAWLGLGGLACLIVVGLRRPREASPPRG